MNEFVELPKGSILGYKILPDKFSEEYLLNGQTSSDWSGIYIQFDIQHAISYLPNHFDRGYDSVVLVEVILKEDLKLFTYKDPRYSIPTLTSAEKAKYLGDCLVSFDATFEEMNSLPLVQSIGEHFRSGIAMYDASDNWECVIPHAIMQCKTFHFHSLSKFLRHPTIPWKVHKVFVYLTNECENNEVEYKCEKYELEDVTLLGAKLNSWLPTQLELHPCEWAKKNLMV